MHIEWQTVVISPYRLSDQWWLIMIWKWYWKDWLSVRFCLQLAINWWCFLMFSVTFWCSVSNFWCSTSSRMKSSLAMMNRQADGWVMWRASLLSGTHNVARLSVPVWTILSHSDWRGWICWHGSRLWTTARFITWTSEVYRICRWDAGSRQPSWSIVPWICWRLAAQ